MSSITLDRPQQPGRNLYVRGLVLVTLAMLLSSTSGVFVRSLPDLDPWTINAYRGGFMGIAMIAFPLLTFQRSIRSLLTRTNPVVFLISGACLAGSTSSYVIAVSLAHSVASVSALTATAPIFAALVAWLFLRERTSAIVLMAATIAFAGILIIAWTEDRDTVGNGIIVTFLGLCVPFLMAAQTVVLKRQATVEMTPALVFGGLSIFILVGLLRGIHLLPLHCMLVLGLMGSIQLGLSMICFMRGAPLIPAVQSMLIAMGDVIFNPLWTWLVYGERVPVKVFIGGGLIIAAILIAFIYPRLRRLNPMTVSEII